MQAYFLSFNSIQRPTGKTNFYFNYVLNSNPLIQSKIEHLDELVDPKRWLSQRIFVFFLFLLRNGIYFWKWK